MSFRGAVQARCPKGCEVEVEIWSFVRGDKDAHLRNALLAGELDLVLCPECGLLFRPESPLVYYDPAAELLVFAFPESYAKEEKRWRKKMGEDLGVMRRAMGADLPIATEPILLFGLEPLRELLKSEDSLEDEVDVAREYCKGLGLKMRRVLRSHARALGLPRLLPCRPEEKDAPMTRKAALDALDALLAADDALESYAKWRKEIASKGPPPMPGKE